MKYLVSAMLLVVGIIHLLPVSGFLGNERLTTLYGLPFHEPNIAILMRHRAMLFGLLGAYLVYAAFRPAAQPIALLAGFVSVLSFLWLCWSSGDYSAQLARVVVADIVALVCLVIASGAWVFGYRRLVESSY